ncbi:conserved hypothetical protein [Tenacibaculum sp. 190524A02b]|uniref:Uncharacterized protein n=1 Tax=Tenacibaculum vairaonense TaxID=3137860 RepID=A0ABP1FA94_9FLAO
MRNLDYNIIKEYFGNLVENHVEIKSFIGYSSEELAMNLAKVKGIESPMLVLFDYQGKLDGNNQRTFASRTISFAVLQQVNKLDDFTKQYEAVASCESLGLSFLSRIYYDSKLSKLKWLYNNFVKDSVRFNEVRYKSGNGLFGMEFTFNLKTHEPLSVNPSVWKDIDQIC